MPCLAASFDSRPAAHAAGRTASGLITAAQSDIYRRLLDDATFVCNHLLMIIAWGRRPVEDHAKQLITARADDA
jgi:hypothetical protein